MLSKTFNPRKFLRTQKKRRPKPARIFAQTRTTLSQFRRKRSAASLIFNVHSHLIQHEAHSFPVISRTSYHCRNALSSPSGKFFCFVLIGFTQLLVELVFVDLFWKWWNSTVGEPFIWIMEWLPLAIIVILIRCAFHHSRRWNVSIIWAFRQKRTVSREPWMAPLQ